MPARACRGCLATSPRLYNIYKNNLYEEFGEVVGNAISESDDLPQHLCGICLAQLSKYILFRNRCRLAQDILQDLKLQGMKLSTSFIKRIDRSKCNLDINLNIITPVGCDLIIQEEISDEPLSESQDDVFYHEVELLPPETLDAENGQEILLDEPEQSHWFTSAESLGDEHFHDDEIRENIILSPSIKPEPDWHTPVDSPEVTEPLSKEILKSTKTTEPKRLHKNRYDDLKMIEEFKTKYNMDVEFLTKEQQINEVREKIRKSSTRLGAGPFCSYCGKSCISEAYLEKHFKECHDESAGTDECDICRYRLPSQQLQRHILTHQVRILCQLCDFTTRNFGAALYHARLHGDNGEPLTYPCKYCESVYEKRELLNSHLLRDHSNKLPWCKFCGKTVMNKSGMRYHVKCHEDLLKSEYRCLHCRLNLVTIEALEKHTSLTCEEYNCVMCGDHFESKMSLKEHLIRQHPRSKHIKLAHCDGCGVKFFGSEPLKRHLGEKNCGSGHPCQTCGETFITEQTLEDHNFESHLKPYQACEICDKAFDAKNYRQHILSVHSTKPESGRRGVDHTSTNLWSMEDSGTAAPEPASEDPNRTLICDVCGKTFLKYMSLKIHMRAHTGERPFCCDICSKGFARKESLKEHMLVHSVDRPHECEECHQRFRRRDALTRHMVCHSKVRRHICRVCDERFLTSTDAMFHINTVHLTAPKTRQQNEQPHMDTQDDMHTGEYTDGETHTRGNIDNDDTQNLEDNEVNAQSTENEVYTHYYMDSEIQTQDSMDHEVETQDSIDNEIPTQDSMDDVHTQGFTEEPHIVKLIPFNRLGKQKMIRVEGKNSDHANYVDIHTQYYMDSGLTEDGAFHVHHENFNTATAVPRITKTIHIKRRRRQVVGKIPKKSSNDIRETVFDSGTLTQVIEDNENTQNYTVTDANTPMYMDNDENYYTHIENETQTQDFIAKETKSVVVLPVNQPMEQEQHVENMDSGGKQKLIEHIQGYTENNVIDDAVNEYDIHSNNATVAAVPRITKTIHIRRRKQMDSNIPTHTQESMDTHTQDLVNDETQTSLVHNLDNSRDVLTNVVPRITKTIHIKHRTKRMAGKISANH